MQEHHLTVRKTARYFTLGTIGPDIEKIWLTCHGYAQLAADFIPGFEPLNNGRHLVLAPEALSRFYLRGFAGRIGATWMTKEDRLNEINDYVNYLEDLLTAIKTELNNDSVKINAMGFSQGTATISRWFVNTNHKVDNLILWAGAMPPELPGGSAQQRFNGTNLIYVLGDEDPYYEEPALKAELFRLKSAGLQPNVLRFKGGHVIDPEMLVRLSEF
jgi:predicted esterase